MNIFSNTYKIAIIFGLIFNGCLMFFTLESTYDALIHVFLGIIMLILGLIRGKQDGTQDSPL